MLLWMAMCCQESIVRIRSNSKSIAKKFGLRNNFQKWVYNLKLDCFVCLP